MNSVDSKIIGQSKPAVELKKMIGLVASSNSPVIINGPQVQEKNWLQRLFTTKAEEKVIL
ncbi:MAG: hypothetical protein CM15mP85_04910 [Rhodobacterales bacterium]|nr:MAG: hypothetical protein CM15mP85_04910 [Rhodobacterales bacterium]